MHYPQAVILPPKIYHYEPKIFGFKVAGKRGSKYFQPPKGNVRYVEDSVQGLEMESIRGQGQAAQANAVTVDFSKKLALNDLPNVAESTGGGEDNEAAPATNADNNRGAQGKKNRKKNANNKK